jgi:hypothetical protein
MPFVVIGLPFMFIRDEFSNKPILVGANKIGYLVSCYVIAAASGYAAYSLSVKWT